MINDMNNPFHFGDLPEYMGGNKQNTYYELTLIDGEKWHLIVEFDFSFDKKFAKFLIFDEGESIELILSKKHIRSLEQVM